MYASAFRAYPDGLQYLCLGQYQAVNDHHAAANFEPPHWLLERAGQVLHEMHTFYQGDAEALRIVEKQRSKLEGKRLCEQITAEQIYG